MRLKRPNRPLLHRMKRYLITDPHYYHDLPTFEVYLQRAFAKSPDLVCLRDKRTSDLTPYARCFRSVAKRVGIENVLINSRIDLAVSEGFWGVHLTSSQFDRIAEAKSAGLFVIVSTHTIEEGKSAAAKGADAVTISPIFPSPGKGEPKGIDFLKHYLHEVRNIDVFVLGGIVSDAQIASLEGSGVAGFASIRYFL